VRLVACVLAMFSLCLGPTGCSSFGKKSANGDRPPSADYSRKRDPSPTPNSDPILGGAYAQPAKGHPLEQGGAILAGRVIDPYEHAPGNAYVRWVCMEDNKEITSNIDVAVNPDGYFTIQGLKPGANYKLLARAKNGERMLAGVSYTAAPNIRVLIQVKEEFANSDTPALPGTPAFQGKGGSHPKLSIGPDSKPGWSPSPGQIGTLQPSPGPSSIGANPFGQEPDLPIQVRVPIPEGTPPGWTPAQAEPTRTWPPTLEIPGTRPKPAVEIQHPGAVPFSPGEPPPPVFPGTSSSLEGPGPARVPSCVLLGKQLVNLALNDINGEPWELKSQRRGKLVLLDFWATYCVPCRETIPKIRTLQARFGSQGLEVVGIAYETGGTPQEQAHRVNALSQRLQANYRQLLGTGSQCPVKTQLNIQFVPTLVLLDENGWILWRHEGQPDRASWEELDRLIQRRLNVRAF
jgi:thiol-disulfide isomerase/thioredoxin